MYQRTIFCAALMAAVLSVNVCAERVEIDRTGAWQITYSGAISNNENGERVFDNTVNTKWLGTHGQTTGWLRFGFDGGQAYAIDGYSITSANDSPDRSPKDWTLKGSNDDGASWTLLDTRVDETGWAIFEKRVYSFANTTPYTLYELDVTANCGSVDLMGFSELELLEGTVDRTELPGLITYSTQNNDREGAAAAFDGNVNTKWLTTNVSLSGWLQFQFAGGSAYAVNAYAISSANDQPLRDPRNWTLQGSNNGIDWTILDTRAGEYWPTRLTRRVFEFANSTAYSYYKLDVSKNNEAGTFMGFSELELLEVIDDPAVIAHTPHDQGTAIDDPLVLSWVPTRVTGAATYTVWFGTDPNFVNDPLTVSGLTEPAWTVPQGAITQDAVYYWRVDITDGAVYPGMPVKFRAVQQAQTVLDWSMDAWGTPTVFSYEKPIANVTATASSTEVSSRSPDRTTRLYGITVDPTVQDPNGLMHTNNPSYMWICNPNQTGPVWIQYAFDQVYALGTMHVWNHNVYVEAELARGMRDVVVSYSLDEVQWTVLGSFTIPKGTSLMDMPPSIGIPFNGVQARYVRITAAESNSNWGSGNFHALSEVRFGKYNEPFVCYLMPDGSAHGNDGQVYFAPELTADGIEGTALGLQPTDFVVMQRTDPNIVESLPLGRTDDCLDSWSMNFYVLMPTRAPNNSIVAGFGDYTAGTGRFITQFGEGIRFWGGSNMDYKTNVPFDINRWQMITVTYDGDTLKVYKNGSVILDAGCHLGLAVPTVRIGGQTAWGFTFMEAVIDQFEICKGVLTQAEIDALKAKLPSQYKALNPVPADGAAMVCVETALSWEAPRDALDPTYDVFLAADGGAFTQIGSQLTSTTLVPPAGLEYGTTYSWYVDTHNGDVGDTWTFTTLPASHQAQLALQWDFENMIEYPMGYEQAIENVTVTASSTEVPERTPERIVNGIGLTVNPYISDPNGAGITHGTVGSHMWICNPGQAGEIWLRFGFDQSYPLGTMMVWNHNIYVPAELDRGMREVTVSYADADSDDPNAWTVLGTYEIPKGTSSETMPPSIGIDFGGVQARYVKIAAAGTAADPNSNWGSGNFHALSEVRFGIHGTTETVYVVPDASGNGNKGIVQGTPAFTGGMRSDKSIKIKPLNYSGWGDKVDVELSDGSVLPLDAADPWSMNLYVYLPQTPAATMMFAGFGGTDPGTGRYLGYIGKPHFWGGHNLDLTSSGPQYAYRRWQMVTAVYNGFDLDLYLNGERIASGARTFQDAPAYVTVAGLDPWGNPRMDGLADGLAIYRGVLRPSQIAAMAELLPSLGDMDWNGIVNAADLPKFAEDWLAVDECTSPSDLNDDCKVNLADFEILGENWLAD